MLSIALLAVISWFDGEGISLRVDLLVWIVAILGLLEFIRCGKRRTPAIIFGLLLWIISYILAIIIGLIR